MSTTIQAAEPIPAQGEMLLRPDLGWAARQRLATADVLAGLRLYPLAATLGWFDIRLRYRGSLLGPFWLTLSTGVMVVALGILYSALFKMELHDYLPYLALSLVMWNTLAGLVGEACTCFLSAEGMIRSVRMPFTLYAGRTLVRNGLILAHNALVILCVYAWFDTWPGAAALLVVPGLLLWVVDGLAACLLLGAVCARFRDIPPIVGSVMQIAFFVSPIIWKPELLSPTGQAFLPFNPFFSLLEIVRGPLLNQVPEAHVWAAAAGWSLLLIAAAWVCFVRVRNRLAFWV